MIKLLTIDSYTNSPYGVKWNTLEWIGSFAGGRSKRVVIEEKSSFSLDLQRCVDKVYISFDNFVLLGDFDMLDIIKGRPLRDLCDIFGLQNLIKGATCYVKDAFTLVGRCHINKQAKKKKKKTL